MFWAASHRTLEVKPDMYATHPGLFSYHHSRKSAVASIIAREEETIAALEKALAERKRALAKFIKKESK